MAKNSQTQTNKKQKVNKNREFAVITYLFLFLFLAMIGYYIYFQIALSENFINNPYNSLQNLFSQHVVRGEIESADGKVLAKSILNEKGIEERVYPYDRMFAHAVGYVDNGKAGIEKQENFSLLRSHAFVFEQLVNDFRGDKNIGDTVVTTLNYDLQQVAYESLGNYDGAVIVMEPSTGKILAMVSKPDYNPNTITSKWEEINASNSSALFNRATQGKYTPGSVFKIFTTLEYYHENPTTYLDYVFDCKSSFTQDGKTIHCASNKAHGQEDLEKSFAKSCNASYANLSLGLDITQFNNLCDSLLFNQDLPVAFESSQSRFRLDHAASDSLVMETGIGQGQTQVSPLHMAMIVSAIANDGVLMKPYMIDHVENYTGNLVSSEAPLAYGTLFQKDETDLLSSYMRTVVTDGTGSKLNVDAYEAYGKTGTAQISDSSDATNAWFVGYAKGENNEDLAVAIVVENSGTGSSYAVPIAKKIFDMYFG